MRCFSAGAYPNETIQTIFEKHSIRRYLDKPVDPETLDLVVEAGLRAPSAGGCQAPMLLVCQDREANARLGRISKSLYKEGFYPVSKAQPSTADENAPDNAFYGAPVVVSVLVPKGWGYGPYDATMAASNMICAAWSLGLGSCFVSRARETLDTPEGRAFLRKAGIPEDYEGYVHVCLGYPESVEHEPKPLIADRAVYWTADDAPLAEG